MSERNFNRNIVYSTKDDGSVAPKKDVSVSQPLIGLREGELESLKLPSILWLESTDPRIFTAITLDRGGMVRIAFRKPNRESLVNVYRTISRYSDGGFGIQDEIHPFFENEGVQFNYEFDSDGKLTKYSDKQNFTPRMQECLGLIQDIVSQRGASISAEATYISDGNQWLEKSIWEKQIIAAPDQNLQERE